MDSETASGPHFDDEAVDDLAVAAAMANEEKAALAAVGIILKGPVRKPESPTPPGDEAEAMKVDDEPSRAADTSKDADVVMVYGQEIKVSGHRGDVSESSSSDSEDDEDTSAADDIGGLKISDLGEADAVLLRPEDARTKNEVLPEVPMATYRLHFTLDTRPRWLTLALPLW